MFVCMYAEVGKCSLPYSTLDTKPVDSNAQRQKDGILKMFEHQNCIKTKSPLCDNFDKFKTLTRRKQNTTKKKKRKTSPHLDQAWKSWQGCCPQTNGSKKYFYIGFVLYLYIY